MDHTKIGVWLINLSANQDRLIKMRRQFEKMAMPWKLFKAVDGRLEYDHLLRAADAQAYARNMGSPILPGKLGVYASHAGVWRDFLASDYQYALVCEDDVVFHDDFIESVNAAYDSRLYWDLIRFNCVRAKLPIAQGVIGKWTLNAYVGPFTGNATYLIGRSTALHLLKAIWPQTRALDHELNLFFKHDFRLIGMQPWSSHTDDGNESTITGVSFNSVKKFKWYKRLPYYRLKTSNYFRRAFWLTWKGMIIPSKKPLFKG